MLHLRHPFSESLLNNQKNRWKPCQGLEEERLLHFHLLRELSFQLHAEESRLLAIGKKTEAFQILEDENAILATLSPETKKGANKGVTKNEHPLFPKAFLKKFPPDLWSRKDRAWEQAMAAEALKLGWKFWVLSCTIQIYELENWHREFQQLLWPKGISLWVDSANPIPVATSPSPKKERKPSEIVWRGAWTLILHPDWQTPKTLDSQLASLPGATKDLNPVWELKYSKTTSRTR
ncbi:MAG: hypothetical protein HYX41_00985 [Bdellovibrio sp.]|nr:hypothetical protein [Bdellovibrio sp.]